MEVREVIRTLNEIASKYSLKVLYLDYTDITLISRIGVSLDVFIQIYVNIKKEKLNMALVVVGKRIYGIDKGGGSYHEHPFENPSRHIDTGQIEIEDFVIKSLEILKRMNLI